jgi:tetratricopeptide (TPR) repeat protein
MATATNWTLMVTLFAYLLATPSFAAHYVVNGFTLGSQIPLESSDYQAYTCVPSYEFDRHTWCHRTQQRNTTLGRGVLTSAILHAQDNTAVYLMADLAPVSLNKQIIQNEIAQLSKELDEQPTRIDWSQQGGLPIAVIVLWGRISLEKIDIPRFIDVDNITDDLIARFGNTNSRFVIDFLGDPVRSAKANLPVYRIVGGGGYLYSASFDQSGRGRRHYVASDFSQPAVATFVPQLNRLLEDDLSRGHDDYELWPEFARAARNLSRATSPGIASEQLDKLFEKYPATKLRSRVWPLLPLGTIDSLESQVHWTVSTYGPKTQFPDIRINIQRFLATHPREPFNEFLYYTIGEFDRALQANPNSIIDSPIRYAIGYKIISSILQDAAKVANIPFPDFDTDSSWYISGPVDTTLTAVNKDNRFNSQRLLGDVVPNFAARAAAAAPWFQAVLRNRTSPHQDDAAYFLGWLSLHQHKIDQALDYFAQAMTVGNGDYRRPALSETIRIMAGFDPHEQADMLAANPIFARQATLWYVAARAAYRRFDFELAIKTAEQGLQALGMSPDLLPVTTDPASIEEAVEKLLPKEVLADPNLDEVNLLEIPYILQAATEIKEYHNILSSIAGASPETVTKKAKQIIVKYSLLLDQPEPAKVGQLSVIPLHKDLRQALALVDITLQKVPKDLQFAHLREWLYYRKIRILVGSIKHGIPLQFAPTTVSDAVSAMEAEFPKSQLMDDALAEQIFAQGVLLGNVTAAEATFRKLINTFPNANAVDNAYTWMAIMYRCAGKTAQAEKINRDIIRLFPFSRHARYARERMSHPNQCKLKDHDSDSADEQP